MTHRIVWPQTRRETVRYATGRGIALLASNGGTTWRRLEHLAQKLAGNNLDNASDCAGLASCYATVPRDVYATRDRGRTWQAPWSGAPAQGEPSSRGLHANTCVADDTCRP